MNIVQINDEMINRNLENAKQIIEIKDKDFPVSAQLVSRKPIRLKKDSFEMFNQTMSKSNEESKFSELSEQGYDDAFVSAVEKTYEDNETTIEPISLDESTLKDLGEPARVDNEEEIKIEKEANEELPQIAGIISDSENEEKVLEERKEYENEENVERIQSSNRPVRSFDDFQEENNETIKSTAKINPINAESIFKEIERKSEVARKELETPESNLNLAAGEKNNEESYESRVARLKREIEEKRRQLTEQRKINETTTGTIQSQKRIFEAAQKSAAELEERNRQIEADNIAQLESLFRETEAEYKDEVTTAQNLEGELTKVEADASLASSRVEELQAINDSLIKSSSEIKEIKVKVA